jgi:4-methylaminobutanoate oxidase (formaldehyde-forming)
MVYTALLNERGGFESDLTITRLGLESSSSSPARRSRPAMPTGSAGTSAPTNRRPWSMSAPDRGALGDGAECEGAARRIGAPDTAARLAPDRLVLVDRRHRRRLRPGACRAHELRRRPRLRALCADRDGLRHVYLALQAAGGDLGLADAGYYALDALRIEAGRRAWGAELGPDETPFEAGTLFAVKLDKPAAFIGREALLARRAQPPAKRLVSLVFKSADAWAWGGEALLLDGEPAGEITSAGWSPKLGACVALGYLRGAAATERHEGTRVEVDIWGERVAATAWDEAGRMQRPAT